MLGTSELQRQVRRLTAFGTLALLGVGATALLLTIAGIAQIRQLDRNSDRIRLQHVALDNAKDRDVAVRRYGITGDSAALGRALAAGLAMRVALDSLRMISADNAAQGLRARAFRHVLISWDSANAGPAIAARQHALRMSRADSIALAGSFARARQRTETLLAEEQRAFRALQKNVATVALYGAAFVLGTVVVIWALRRLGQSVLRQESLVVEKQALLEEQAAQLQQRAQSLEEANRALAKALNAGAESEALLSTAFSSAPLGFAFLDRDLRYRRVNEWMARLNGTSVEEHAGRRTSEVNPETASLFEPCYQQVLRTGAPLSNVEISSESYRDGQKPRQWLANFYPISVEPRGLIGVGAVVSDISERKLLEEQFRQSQKMEAIGRLAGGVAHDFNNLLTAISGFSEFALTTLAADHPAREDIEQAIQACDRAGALTRQLLAFSRQQVLNPTVMSLNDIVTQMEPMLRRLIGVDVGITLDLDPSIALIKADKGQLEQVLMNVVLNARDAMPNGGRLTVETGNVNLHDGFVQHGHFRANAGPHVMLCVTDTGSGMDASTRARIFEPFFTTKAPGKGTGLGLSTVYGIVQQSGGSIWVYSEPGIGTTFKIYFPQYEAAPVEQEVPIGVSAEPAGSGYVLVVDDEEPIRRLVVRALHKVGYQTLEASNGTQGIEMAHANALVLRAIVADVVMPGMGGREMMRLLRAHGITVPVLYMSGWTADAIDMRSVLGENDSFLEKPFSPDSLSRAVNRIVAERALVFKQPTPSGTLSLGTD